MRGVISEFKIRSGDWMGTVDPPVVICTVGSQHSGGGNALPSPQGGGERAAFAEPPSMNSDRFTAAAFSLPALADMIRISKLPNEFHRKPHPETRAMPRVARVSKDGPAAHPPSFAPHLRRDAFAHRHRACRAEARRAKAGILLNERRRLPMRAGRIDLQLSLHPVPLPAQAIDAGAHPLEQRFCRDGRYTRSLQGENIGLLPTDLDAQAFDFGEDKFNAGHRTPTQMVTNGRASR
jgi:hypothetical protein